VTSPGSIGLVTGVLVIRLLVRPPVTGRPVMGRPVSGVARAGPRLVSLPLLGRWLAGPEVVGLNQRRLRLMSGGQEVSRSGLVFHDRMACHRSPFPRYGE